MLSIDLMDGRTISVPFAWHLKFFSAAKEQLLNWEVVGGGYGIH